MLARTMWKCTVRRVKESTALKILAAVCMVDYIGYLFLASAEQLGWTSFTVLFLLSVACWFWAVTWPPFWNHLTYPWQGPGTRRYLGFVERFGIVALFFVQIVYSIIFVVFLLNVSKQA